MQFDTDEDYYRYMRTLTAARVTATTLDTDRIPYLAGVLAEACRLIETDPLALEAKHWRQLSAYPGWIDKGEAAQQRARQAATARPRRSSNDSTIARTRRAARTRQPPPRPSRTATGLYTTELETRQLQTIDAPLDESPMQRRTVGGLITPPGRPPQ